MRNPFGSEPWVDASSQKLSSDSFGEMGIPIYARLPIGSPIQCAAWVI